MKAKWSRWLVVTDRTEVKALVRTGHGISHIRRRPEEGVFLMTKTPVWKRLVERIKRVQGTARREHDEQEAGTSRGIREGRPTPGC